MASPFAIIRTVPDGPYSKQVLADMADSEQEAATKAQRYWDGLIYQLMYPSATKIINAILTADVHALKDNLEYDRDRGKMEIAGVVSDLDVDDILLINEIIVRLNALIEKRERYEVEM